MITFIVDKVRFAYEYHNHISKNPLKYVNWYCDDELLHCYITTTSEVFYFYCDKSKVPVEVMDMIDRKGEVRGIDKNEEAEVNGMMNQVVSAIKFNQVGK
jgi:hypothetical protein